MKIGGLLKFSMIDFPGKISAIVFTQGCNLNCKYCHNPELIPPAASSEESYSEEDILDYLEKRKGAIDGLVITGGEPLLQPDIKEFILKVKNLGYLIKLDTNGTFPQRLSELLQENLIDFVAMDIKAPFEKYEAICGVHVNMNAVKNSMDIILNSGVAHEFRTTFDKTVLNDEDIKTIQDMVPSNFRVQECLPVKNKDVLKVEQ